MKSLGSVIFFMGNKIEVGGILLDPGNKYATTMGILLLVDGVLTSSILITIMKQEHFLDEKPALVSLMNYAFYLTL